MIFAEPRTQPLNGTTQARPRLERAVRDYVRAYASLHGRRKVAEDLSKVDPIIKTARGLN